MFGREPTLILKVIEEVIRAAIPMALIFGLVHWTEAQTGAVLLFVGVLIGGLAMLATRSQVSPVQDVQTALDAPAGTTQKQLAKIIEKQN